MAPVSVSYLIYLHNDNFIWTFFHIPFVCMLQVASGLVFTVFPCILILFGIIGKLAAVLIAIPYPVLGGVQIIGFGIFMGLVMSNLQYIDMQSTINLAIIGVSTLLGLAAGINTGIILNNERHFMVIGERSFCYSFFYLSQMVV